jgi:hypothetical protein
MLAGLPISPGAAFPAWLGFFVLVTPYLAGVLAGVMTVRIAPTPFLEAAPLWGLLTGSLTALVIGVLAKFSGGPLGAGRLGTVGPAAAEVTVVSVLEIGVTAAVVAGLANWLILRHHIKRLASAAQESAGSFSPAPGSGVASGAAGLVGAAGTTGPMPAVVDEEDDVGGHRIYLDPWAGERVDEDEG